MHDTLELQLSLLRGETPNPIDVRSIGRPGRLMLNIQKKAMLSDRLAVNLLAMIANGRLQPGTQVPPERRIANALMTSRVCVRAALNRLKSIGYLEAVQRSGTRVVTNGEQLEFLQQASRRSLEDLAEFCHFFDELLIERCMANANQKKLALLAGSLLQSIPTDDQPPREFEWRAFMAEMSGSKVFVLLMQHLTRGLRAYFDTIHRAPKTAQMRDNLYGIYTRLATQIARGDLASVLVLLREKNELLHRALRPPLCVLQGGLAEDEMLVELAAQQPETLRDAIAREIASMIATRQLEAGDRLLSERRLADLFGVSRECVRKALAILKLNGLVEADERAGTRAIMDTPDNELARGLSTSASEDFSNFKDLCAIRHYLEVCAAKRAATHATDTDMLAMRRILSEMKRPIDSPQRKIDLDLNLHLTIARAAGSALHLYVSEVLRNIVLGYFNYSLSEPKIGAGRDALLYEQHTDIVKAIAAKDPQLAAEAMERHVRTFRDGYEASVA
ncbi:hypothetical protein DEM27_04790 [Metarhizobium album]|uniref:HTH gntR-type domain-containing protein n=1 Tax=Metarhizobium album TaxID=2182425 RepID=A0A2U2DUG8_9HYPH|nr:GntR family transcriptional regulator [Rhizobium album]PWE56965.1 hypothetical protein DEM27_04790 [Rhizobium album]